MHPPKNSCRGIADHTIKNVWYAPMADRTLFEEHVRRRVRLLRQAQGLQSQQLARKAGLSVSTYSCLETGHMRFGIEQLFRVLAAMRVSIGDVWPGSLPEGFETVTETFIGRAIESQPPIEEQRPTLEEIVTAVASHCGVSVEALRSRDAREHRLAEARGLAGLLVREAPHLTLISLSRHFQRDPSCLSHAMNRLERRLAVDQSLQASVDRLRRTLRLPEKQPNDPQRQTKDYLVG